jgi:hypothetical protein
MAIIIFGIGIDIEKAYIKRQGLNFTPKSLKSQHFTVFFDTDSDYPMETIIVTNHPFPNG